LTARADGELPFADDWRPILERLGSGTALHASDAMSMHKIQYWSRPLEVVERELRTRIIYTGRCQGPLAKPN
jgi:hypothetical protein